MQDLMENCHNWNLKGLEYEKLVKEFELDKNSAEKEI